MIDIVLATYNGERYLAEQIASIQKNTLYQEIVSKLIIVDDGSDDNTENIVQLLAYDDDKIEWHKNTSQLHGPSNNFSFGLSLTTAEYIMLCDQDDVWLPSKIEDSLSEIKQLENIYPDSPKLVFSDKLIVDENLSLISDSYFKIKNIPFDWYQSFDQLCQQNVASGCTMLFNRALATKALPIPKNAYMHDWWLVLVASRCGHLQLIEQPLIKYRQHANNSIGANKVSRWQLFTRFFSHLQKFEKSFMSTIYQAQAFQSFERDNQLPQNKTIQSLANIQRFSKLKRMNLLFKRTITRSNLLGKIALLIVLLKI